ncbi:UNVERIFIED_CONTAM: Retrovirus-related Pol polyprotein from transposon TNT 1-94 [Sesamum latifolium]|uniref:Retrovirus-related Pol polyprotein from transposon TNT 1-94 n=1 Tax=Sesamum latifolium TaxID=2727402 RepID=A0AAW2UJN5_9LAMI
MVVYMISDINNVQSSVNMHEWLIDSGCSFHMSPYKEIFSNYKTDNFGFVAMANEKLCGIKGLGDVCMTFDNGYKLTLKNVRHVPDLCHNLMSCSALEEEGLEGRWGKGIMKIMKDDKASLWHRRLGHISLKGLDLLHKNGLLPDKFKDLNFCNDCVLGKQHKVHFPASPYPNSPTSNGILDYVYADVWGPSNVETHGGNLYFLSIIDNMSRKVFVFLMKQKGDTGLPLYSQQNGVAERMNRTLLNKVRCLLISSGLPKTFWGEALLTAAYLVNRSPSVPLLGKTPESVWSNFDIDLSSLRIFGCAAFALINGNKLEPRSQKCAFIGYPEGVKGIDCGLEINQDLRTEEDYNIELTFNEVEENNEDNQQGEGFREEEADRTDRNPEHTENYSLARDRERRERRIPSRFKDFHLALNIENSEPTSYDDAIKSPKSELWIKAMKEEMKSLKDNKTWVLVPKPKNTSIVDSKWIFKLKNENDSLRYKARLVAKGFTQKEGIDYTEIFSPVVKYTTVRIILALTAHFNWELKQMDVKTAFLHGDRDENIYMEQPYGFVDNKNPDFVCLLKKSLYGLKQSPRQWNKKFDNFMKTLRFHKSAYDPCLYFKTVNNAPCFLFSMWMTC